jgi:hydroxymethylpyrimidine pyrophosphatase-like HAD family hydrolase
LHRPATAAEHHPVPTVRLVASDLDGTLLGPGAVLTDRTRAALAAADAAGIVVVAATGRPATTASERLAGAPTVRYLVCENGAVLYDRHEAAVIARHPMDDRAVPAVIEAVRDGVPDAGFGWEAPGGYGAEARFLTMSPPRDGVPDVVVDRLGPPYPTQVTKVLVGHARLVRDDLLAAVEPCLVDGLVATASSVRFVEIAGAGIDKAYGVARLCERLGVGRAEVAALGDHINDIALLRWAGRSVAMGDAHPRARDAAGETTGSSAEDGAAAWLEALLAEAPAPPP